MLLPHVRTVSAEPRSTTLLNLAQFQVVHHLSRSTTSSHQSVIASPSFHSNPRRIQGDIDIFHRRTTTIESPTHSQRYVRLLISSWIHPRNFSRNGVEFREIEGGFRGMERVGGGSLSIMQVIGEKWCNFSGVDFTAASSMGEMRREFDFRRREGLEWIRQATAWLYCQPISPDSTSIRWRGCSSVRELDRRNVNFENRHQVASCVVGSAGMPYRRSARCVAVAGSLPSSGAILLDSTFSETLFSSSFLRRQDQPIDLTNSPSHRSTFRSSHTPRESRVQIAFAQHQACFLLEIKSSALTFVCLLRGTATATLGTLSSLGQ